MDYRRMFDDKEHLYAFDLDGSDRTLEIEGVTAGELVGEKARKTKKPMVSFVGEKKKLAINKTNGKVIAQLYGTDADGWVGKLITIFPTTTDFGGQTVDCIRVRPQRPERADRGEAGQRGNGRSGGNPAASRQRSGKESKPDRDAAEASYKAATYLIVEYEQCDLEHRLAELKVERGRAWPTLLEADRKAVGDAALAAKARIDAAAASGGTSAPTDDSGGDGDGAQDIDEAEAAELARLDREAAARGE